jgi:SAM-dependent methyltransferase
MLSNRFWNEYLQHYDAAIATLHPYRDLIGRCIGWGNPQAGQTIVDLGCGTGNLLTQLGAALQGPATLIGIERSVVGGRIASSKLAGDDRFRLHAGDLGQPGWSAPLGPIDTAFMLNVLYDVPDPAALLVELHARLRPGGRLILSNPHTPRPIALLEAHARWREQASLEQRLADDEHLPARRWMLEVNIELARRARGRTLHFLGVDTMRELLDATGFSVKRIDARAYAGLNLLVEAEKIG